MHNHAPTKSRIPEFRSIEEEAEFWDRHSTTEFEEEWEPVAVEVSPDLGHVLSVRLDRDTHRRLSVVAKQKGLGASTLARMWVLEKLVEAENTSAAKPVPLA